MPGEVGVVGALLVPEQPTINETEPTIANVRNNVGIGHPPQVFRRYLSTQTVELDLVLGEAFRGSNGAAVGVRPLVA